MLPILFAARVSWIGLLLVLAVLFAVWFLLRAGVDFVEWFKEEIIDDFRDRRRKRKDRGSKR